MITFLKVKNRHTFSMSKDDLDNLAEVIWLLKHSPPPCGYNRRPLTTKQQKVVDDIFDLIAYPDGYGEALNNKTGQ
jgi:hypothetical protein